MPRLRLSTQGRFVLSGFSPETQDRLRQSEWVLGGDLSSTGAGSLALIPVKKGGLSLSKDGRIFVADGQKTFWVNEELEMDERVYDELIVLTVKGREIPSMEKIFNMARVPSKPPSAPKRDPGAMYLFEDLAP